MLNATYRLLITAKTEVTAEGEWWDSLPDEMKKLYIQEHPNSKYAKGYGLSQPKENKPEQKQGEQPPAQPKPPVNQPQPSGRKGQGLVKRPAMHQHMQQPKVFKPKDEQTAEAIKKLPKKAQSFVKNGGTNKGSKERKESGENVKAQSRGLARGILKDTVGIAKGLNSIRKIVNGKPEPGDVKKAASFIGTILGTSAMVGLLGVSGPVGFLAFMAVKHAAAPDLYNIARNALQKRPPGEKPGYGYWKDEDTWVPLSKKEFDALTDEEVEHYQDTGEDKSGKFNKFENRTHSSVNIATEDEELMKRVIDAIADYAENGDISDDAWSKAIQETAGTEEQQ